MVHKRSARAEVIAPCTEGKTTTGTGSRERQRVDFTCTQPSLTGYRVSETRIWGVISVLQYHVPLDIQGTARVSACTVPGPYTLTGCTTCAADFHVSSNTCTACAAGKTRAAGDDVNGSDTSCTATLCAENEYVSSNVCIACAAGKTNAADNDAKWI